MSDTLEAWKTEYAATASYFTAVINSRFTVVGLYVAALAVLLREGSKVDPAWILLLSVGVWTLELRTRMIFWGLVERGKQIEAEAGITGGLFETGVRGAKRTKVLFWHVPISETMERRWPTHSFGIDLIFISALVYAISRILREYQLGVVVQGVLSVLEPNFQLVVRVLAGLLLAALGYKMLGRLWFESTNQDGRSRSHPRLFGCSIAVGLTIFLAGAGLAFISAVWAKPVIPNPTSQTPCATSSGTSTSGNP